MTEKKTEQNNNKKSEERYQRLVESLGKNFFVYMHDINGFFNYLSPSVTAMLGYSLKEFTTHYSTYLTNDPINKKVDKYTALSIKGIKQPSYLVKIRHKNGSVKTLEVTETPVKDQQGKVIAVEGLAHDITDLLKKQEAIIESEIKFKTLYLSSQDAIMILEPPDFHFVSANQATLKMFGAKSEKQFIKLGPWDVSPAEQPDGQRSTTKAKKEIVKALKEGSNFFTWNHQRLNGRVFSANVLLTKMQIENKVMIQATVRDISEQKKQERELTEKIAEMEKMNRLMVGRELNMIELKNKIRQLEEIISKTKKNYKI